MKDKIKKIPRKSEIHNEKSKIGKMKKKKCCIEKQFKYLHNKFHYKLLRNI